MRTAFRWIVLASVGLYAQAGMAEEVRLPAPVFEWSAYLLIIFTILVALDIFFVRKKNDLRTDPVGELVAGRRDSAHNVAPSTTVKECARLMIDQHVDAVLVLEKGELLGIFTERDGVSRVIAAGLDASATLVSEVMTKDPLCVDAAISLEEAQAISSQRRLRHLPVIDKGHVVGLLWGTDLIS